MLEPLLWHYSRPSTGWCWKVCCSIGMSSCSSLTCHLFQGSCTVHDPSACTGLLDRVLCTPVTFAPLPLNDTDEPHHGLANFHEILTVTLFTLSKLVRLILPRFCGGVKSSDRLFHKEDKKHGKGSEDVHCRV